MGDIYFLDQESLVKAGEPPSRKDDIFAMGQVFTRMFYGRYATAGELREAVDQKKANNEPITDVEDLIYQMTADRADRISVEGMKAHPLFKDLEWQEP
mmetsp:Transcript_134882/g.233788  ORF Transcript_134882/g.233788 Transcript_134882/m.233788 type:complete len:98 (+) Transcript_134882:129-422(+)